MTKSRKDPLYILRMDQDAINPTNQRVHDGHMGRLLYGRRGRKGSCAPYATEINPINLSLSQGGYLYGWEATVYHFPVSLFLDLDVSLIAVPVNGSCVPCVFNMFSLKVLVP